MPSPASVSAASTASSRVIPHATMATSSPSCAMRLPPISTVSSGAVRTSVLPRRVRMKEIPVRSAIASTSLAAWFASDGCSTVEPWMARNDAMSSSAICDGPSSPIETPACEPERRRFAREIAPMRMKSYARERNAAKVEAKGTQPRTCMPTAAATSWFSAMNISKYRSSWASRNSSECVELDTSPSSATTSPRMPPSAASASP